MQEEKAIQTAIGDRIKEIREKKHISQDKLAELSGVTNTTISAYENHKKRIGLANLASIAKGLDITIDVLYYGAEEEAPITKAAGDLGKKIVNCVFELYKENVLYDISKDALDDSVEWEVNSYSRPLRKFVKTLHSMGGDYDSTPEQAAYVENVKTTAAYEINKEKRDIEEEMERRKNAFKNLPSQGAY